MAQAGHWTMMPPALILAAGRSITPLFTEGIFKLRVSHIKFGSDIVSKIIWTGARESDIAFTGDFFSGAITLYGRESKCVKSFCQAQKYRIDHNHITQEQTDFMVSHERELIQTEPDIIFMSYNPNLIFKCPDDIIRHTVCMNHEPVMKFLDSKISFRKFSNRFVHTLPPILLKGKDCCAKRLKALLPDSNNWIVQADIASGGCGTFLLDSDNERSLAGLLQEDATYLVSPYYSDNIPINIHAVIYQDEILITPGSVQIMGLDQNRIVYRGADYITYRKIKKSIRQQFIKDVEMLCREIQTLGYRGILGIDAIIVDDIAWILEANNRFQASTILLNKTLSERHLPSLHALNYEAFQKKRSELIDQATLRKLQVNYSIYTFIKDDHAYHAAHILQRYPHEKHIVNFISDGYEKNQDAEAEAYLFRIIFDTNITDITNQKSIRLHPNIDAPENTWYNGVIHEKDFQKIKISLINQGVVLSDAAKEYLQCRGGMRPGVYNAVDLTLNGKYIVNSPLSVKFAALSPYLVQYEQGTGLRLDYYGNSICSITIDPIDQTAELMTSSGVPVSRICLLATDRLRIQNSDCCTFKERDVPCRFCEAPYRNIKFSIEDIQEAVSFYMERTPRPFRHVLIGGLSNELGQEKENICAIIQHIRAYSDMPIYLMCLPPLNVEDIEEYVKLGVTEIGFNLEIFDRELAAQIMPGKGTISLKHYQCALEKAVSLLGRTGAVRTAFVVGLESMDSLLEGIEFACRCGVAPILSVFRPIPFTEMENVIPPTNQWLLEMYKKALAICEKYGMKLGPQCPACQNNTLSFDLLPDEE